jgi:hypothetical protein
VDPTTNGNSRFRPQAKKPEIGQYARNSGPKTTLANYPQGAATVLLPVDVPTDCVRGSIEPAFALHTLWIEVWMTGTF